MSKRSDKLRAKLARLVAQELKGKTSIDEIIGALETVKCNLAIASATSSVALSQTKNKPNDHN